MITFSELTKTGNREINEDSVGIRTINDGYLFLLADGLGGHGKGEVASSLAIETAMEKFDKIKNTRGLLEECFLASQNKIIDEQAKVGLTDEMKTTLAGLHIYENRASCVHIGDSRIYMFHKNKMITRTLDHSVPQILAATGQIKEKDIRHHEDRNRLLRVMGVEWDSPKYEVSAEVVVDDKTSFLLCSDGFWELINEKDMCKFLGKAKSAKEWLELMEKKVLENGRSLNMDNYSAIAVFSR